MTQLEIQRWAEEAEAILGRVRQALADSPTAAVRNLVEELPEAAAGADEPISLAFAGQYSAGKSSLISALTGRDDIAVGAGITTGETHRYEWNGVVIIDTPGIHTSLRPDHDAIAYAAISGADLLVFVTTNELFDGHIAEYYRRLTIERDKGHETILVVNKMGRHADGNTADSRAVITEGLRAPLAPFTPEALSITFTDAASALEASDETEPEFREMLKREGNLEALVESINVMVAAKGLNARQTTALYRIEQTLADAIANEPTDDPDLDALTLVYNRQAHSLRQAITQLDVAVDTAVSDAGSAVRQAGFRLSETYYPGVSEDEVNRAIQQAEDDTQQAGAELGQRIERAFNEVVPELAQGIQDVMSGDLFQRTKANLQARAGSHDWSEALQKAHQGTAALGDLAGKFAINSTAVAQGASGLARFSGSAAHGVILNVGHFFGHSFRPWEAVRYAGFIGRAAPVLSILGIGLSIGAQFYADRRENQQSAAAQQLRLGVVAEFNRVADQMMREAKGQAEAAIHELLGEPLRQVEEHRSQLNAFRQERSVSLSRLASLRAETVQLIQRNHGSGP